MLRYTLVTPLILILLLSGCNNRAADDLSLFPKETTIGQWKETQFVPTLAERVQAGKNVIYTPAFLSAWQELRRTVKGNLSPSRANTKLQLIDAEAAGAEKDLPPGASSKTIQINGPDIRINCRFRKSLPLQVPMENLERCSFKAVEVKGFGMQRYRYDLASTVRILYYQNDDTFAIALTLRDTTQELILAKGLQQDAGTLSALLLYIGNALAKGQAERALPVHRWKYELAEGDDLAVPAIRFNIAVAYPDMEGQPFRIDQDTYRMETARQRTAFLLDELGAKVESDVDISVAAAAAAPSEKAHPKHLLFNKPFTILLRKARSPKPYFLMKVETPELMVLP